MSNDHIIEFITAVSWPVVAVATLFYIWKSDALTKLLKISNSVEQLKVQVKDLLEAEERLRESGKAFAEIGNQFKSFEDRLISMERDVESILDRVPLEKESDRHPSPSTASAQPVNHRDLFLSVESAWSKLTDAMREKFGSLDGRMVGSEAYRLTHGNRKGPKLNYEQADEIGRLHSEIKSYRRRQSQAEDWLTNELAAQFINDANKMTDDVREI